MDVLNKISPVLSEFTKYSENILNLDSNLLISTFLFLLNILVLYGILSQKVLKPRKSDNSQNYLN